MTVVIDFLKGLFREEESIWTQKETKLTLQKLDETMEALYQGCVEAKLVLTTSTSLPEDKSSFCIGSNHDFSAMLKINKALRLHDELVKEGRENNGRDRKGS